MSGRQSAAIGTLVRWRAFQESLAERERQQASARQAEARTVLDAAEAVAGAIRSRRDELLGAGAIDLALLQAVAEFERIAADEVQARTEVLDDARRAHDQTVSAHMEARSRSRVAGNRHDRVLAEERDHEEKRLFDRMASLIAAAAMEKGHGETT